MPREKKSNLPESSRVSENVLEYYMKYGRERELEKFMRFRSPKNSPMHSSSSNEDEHSKHLSCENLQDFSKISRIKTERMELKSQSMPSINKPSSHSTPQEHIIPVQLEDEKDQDVPKTPQQQSPEMTKQTHTPESAAKVHKRLEWDSLADVGYEKSKSTSNISIVERMLLREFFEVTSNTPKHTNSSESDIRHLEQEIADLGSLKKHFSKKAQKDESKYSTPPLAHSTQYENSKTGSNSMRAKAKSVQAATNTTSSLQQKFEKYAQTSLLNTEMKSQEVQVTLRPVVSSPFQVSSSVSSFEYQSRRSNNSSGEKSTELSNVPNHAKGLNDAQHPFVKSVNEMLEKRKALSSKNEKQEKSSNDPIRESDELTRLYSDFQQLIVEDKENSSTSSDATTSSNAPTIDFGIQLIFQIMKAKTVDPKQKKKLVKNIVKRITKIANNRELHGIVSKTSALFTTETEGHSKDMERRKAGGNESNSRKTTSVSVVSNVEVKNVPNKSDRSSAKQNIKSAETQAKRPIREKPPADLQNEQNNKCPSISKEQKQQPVKRGIAKKATAGKDENSTLSNNATSTTTTSSTSSKDMPVTLLIAPGCRVIGTMTTAVEYSASNTSTSATSTTSQTQEPSKTNDDQVVGMQEWLNPMTQSEIEFEKKKSAKKQAKPSSSKTPDLDCREQQLKWIACEIERLQSLRKLLLKDDSRQTAATATDESHNRHQSTNTQTNEKLYDTVYSDQTNKSSTMPKKKSATSSPTKVKKPSKSSESPKKDKKQRSKIDTPPDSNDQESVRSLVRRRKQELLNHYQPHDIHHFTCVPQACVIERPTTSTAAALHMANQFLADNCGFYSQPMRMQQTVPAAAYYTYPPPTHTQVQCRNYADQRKQHPRSSEPPAREAPNGKSTHNQNAKSTSTQAAPESSSAFRDSSDLTVPMGSYATSATPTTTHQYDDVAAAAAATSNRPTVASQTGQSLRRSRPIYETRRPTPQPHNVIPYTTFMTPYGPVGRSTTCVQTQPFRATAYALQFVGRAAPENDGSSSSDSTSESTTTSTSEELRILAAQAGPSLQDALQQRRPEFLENAKSRKSVINRIQKLRQEREQELRKIADANLSVTTLDKKLNDLPPPATEQLRLFSTKEMKAMSKKRLANLPEVIAGQDRKRDERSKLTNRLLREVYNKRLKQRVHDGKLDFQHSRTLI